MDQHIEVYKSLRRLPRLMRDISMLQKSLSKARDKD
jgi:hypothetical protein